MDCCSEIQTMQSWPYFAVSFKYAVSSTLTNLTNFIILSIVSCRFTHAIVNIYWAPVTRENAMIQDVPKMGQKDNYISSQESTIEV